MRVRSRKPRPQVLEQRLQGDHSSQAPCTAGNQRALVGPATFAGLAASATLPPLAAPPCPPGHTAEVLHSRCSRRGPLHCVL